MWHETLLIPCILMAVLFITINIIMCKIRHSIWNSVSTIISWFWKILFRMTVKWIGFYKLFWCLIHYKKDSPNYTGQKCRPIAYLKHVQKPKKYIQLILSNGFTRVSTPDSVGQHYSNVIVLWISLAYFVKLLLLCVS